MKLCVLKDLFITNNDSDSEVIVSNNLSRCVTVHKNISSSPIKWTGNFSRLSENNLPRVE